MKIDNSGLSLGVERINRRHMFITIKAVGTITHEDYIHMIPVINGALKGMVNPEIKMLVNITEFDGWKDLDAIWDEIKFGLDHKREFTKIAIVGDNRWEEKMIKIVSWFMNGEMKHFDSLKSALEWLE